MLRGIRSNAMALTPLQRAQEVVANNLANVQTTGFRQDRTAFHHALDAAASPSEVGAGPGPLALTPRLDRSSGAIETTGDPNHLAISGAGFFVVQSEGGERYTRDGGFTRSADGTLLHRSGAPFLGEGGPIVAPSDLAISVGSDGRVTAGEQTVGRLRVVRLPEASALSHEGAGLLRSETPGEADAESRVLQGSLEASNGDPVGNLIEMMTLVRAFEANQRAILTQDQTVGRLLDWAAS